MDPVFERTAGTLGRLYKRARHNLPPQVRSDFARLLVSIRPFFIPGAGCSAGAALREARPSVGALVARLARLSERERATRHAGGGAPPPPPLCLSRLLDAAAPVLGPSPVTPPPGAAAAAGQPGTPPKSSRLEARAASFVPGRSTHALREGLPSRSAGPLSSATSCGGPPLEEGAALPVCGCDGPPASSSNAVTYSASLASGATSSCSSAALLRKPGTDDDLIDECSVLDIWGLVADYLPVCSVSRLVGSHSGLRWISDILGVIAEDRLHCGAGDG
mmetsp:Transcript_10622/g.33585  ORF Transcript_10622/g.33585 Transcript_10622/m.33585 type:complete len:276 (+) Transcript_10622:89-916(+)